MIPERFRDGSLVGPNHPSWRGGGSKHPLYFIWKEMLRRCTNPACTRWDRYGGRGITVCERWLDFWVFVGDVGPRPPGRTPGNRALYTLERVDNDGPYSPENVRWATWAEQRRNTSRKSPEACPQGHRYTDETSVINSNGFRECLICKRNRGAAYMRRKRSR